MQINVKFINIVLTVIVKLANVFRKLSFLMLFLLGQALYAQLGIGTDMPDSAAQLDIKATDRGVLIPRVALESNTDEGTITAGNVESLLIFNTTKNQSLSPGYYYWYSGQWQRLVTEDQPDAINALRIVDQDYTIVTDDRTILGDAKNRDVTISLPDPADHKGKKVTIKKEDPNENYYVKVTGEIAGILSDEELYTAVPFTGWDFLSDGIEWRIVNRF